MGRANANMKDQNAPRRPLSGYMAYIATIREDVREETGKKGIELAPFLSQRWNDLDENQKAKFNDKAAKQMQKWKVAMAKYKKTQSYKDFQAKKKAQKLGKKPKDKNAPKRPMSAYFIFSNDVRANVQEELGTSDFGAVAKRVKQMWDALTDAEKGKYQGKAEKAKAAYQKTLEKYQKSKEYAAYQDKLAAFKEAQKLAKKALKAEAKAQPVIKR